MNFVLLVPAHDEEAGIAETVASLRALDYPPHRRRIIVVADNCNDATASVAARAGADVWERRDEAKRGKGYALAWAIDRALSTAEVDAICVIDADCVAAPNLLRALAARLRAGAKAVQAAYIVANPEQSSASALRYAGFALVNFVAPLGRDQLGLSAGLLGTGMAFRRELLERAPWSAFSYAEDREQHMHWVAGGERVAFAPETHVASPMPTRFSDSTSQQSRWDSGRLHLLVTLTPRLLARALRRRDRAALDCALQPAQPPQAVLLALSTAAAALGRLGGSPPLIACGLASGVAQVVYVVGGLRLVHAPASVWRALGRAPVFVARRLLLIGRGASRRGPRSWERTRRAAASHPTTPPGRVAQAGFRTVPALPARSRAAD